MGANTLQLDRSCSITQDATHLHYLNSMDRQLERVRFDVSGQEFFIHKDKLTRGPSSQLKELYYCFKDTKDTLYIDRAPIAFGAILAWYQTGELHIPMSLCPGAFLKELEFWDIKHTKLARCCFYRVKCFLDEQETLRKFQKAVSDDDDTASPQICYRACQRRRNFRSRVWSIVDYRESTFSARAYFMMTVVMVLLSIFIPAYMTDPLFLRSLTNCERLKLMKYNNMADVDIVEPFLSDCTKEELPFKNVTTYDPRQTLEGKQYDNFSSDVISGGASKELVNDSSILYVMINVNQSLRNHKMGWTVVKIPNIYLPVRALVTLETITAIFFLCDFALRIATCPDVMRYFKSVINVSDAVSLIGILVHTFMLQFYSHKRHYDIWVIALEYLQMLRSFRLFRIVKNVKASRVLVYSIFQNIKDLSVLGLFLVVGSCIFASILYVCEDNSTIGSIPVGWYWALVTMTTVGYGDVTPKTPFGRFFACLCATSGVLLFALTVPIFTNHFIILYQYSAINTFPEDVENSEPSDLEEVSQSAPEKQDGNATYVRVNKDDTSTANHIERFV